MVAQHRAAGASLSLEELRDQKHLCKKAMRDWEHAFEESHSGLVPTHVDKKHDMAYCELKAKAKQVEHALEVGRKATDRKSEGEPTKGRRRSSGELLPRIADVVATVGVAQFPVGASEAARPVRARTGSDSAFAFESGRISLSPFHIFQLLLACALPCALFVMAFSLMGFGAMVFDYLVSNSGFFYPLTLSAAFLLIVLYLFDVSYWVHPVAVVARRFFLGFCLAFLLLGACLASREYPYAALLLLFFLAPCAPKHTPTRPHAHTPARPHGHTPTRPHALTPSRPRTARAPARNASALPCPARPVRRARALSASAAL
jgi:hypothetical protein